MEKTPTSSTRRLKITARDLKILEAMLSNLYSFLDDAEKKANGPGWAPQTVDVTGWAPQTVDVTFILKPVLTQKEQDIEFLEKLCTLLCEEEWTESATRLDAFITRIKG